MPVRRLRARTFRNLADARVELPDGVTLLAGPNGAGKTNLLEALYFGLTGASWRTRAERELIAFGSDHARVEVEIRSGSQRSELTTVAQRAAAKTRQVDGNPVRSGATDRAARPAVAVFSPDRLELVKGPPAVRRSHLDQLVSALWPARAESRRRYGRALAQRNALLARIRAGSAPADSLDAWDLELAREGAAVIAARADAVAKLAEVVPRAGDRARPRRRARAALRAPQRRRRHRGPRLRAARAPRRRHPPRPHHPRAASRRDPDLARRPRAAPLWVAGPAARRPAGAALLRARGAARDRRGAAGDAPRRRDERARRGAARASHRPAWPPEGRR